jgi:phosphoribosylaminoimidazolecarboxamide formyltransferase / IMP cyclohydrolase
MITPIKSALISVYYKDGIDTLCQALHAQGAVIYSTGGTRTYIENLGIPVISVESVTGYPEILGGRVKTLHPAIFGGILGRRDLSNDQQEMQTHGIPSIDLVVVDLYPFAETLRNSNDESEVTEKIDIGGISLIRAAAKNHRFTTIISRKEDIPTLTAALETNGGTTAEQRRKLAATALEVSSSYDSMISAWLSGETVISDRKTPLRYGENPHQPAWFKGDLDALFEQLQGKELSYNNLLDADSAVQLMADFKKESDAAFGILKHNNACGFACRSSIKEAYTDALRADPVSAFGGVLIANRLIDSSTAELLHDLFFEMLIAPDYEASALALLGSKKNRILLKQRDVTMPTILRRSALNGELWQARDASVEDRNAFRTVTKRNPSNAELTDLEFALKMVKHTRSNAIVLAANKQLLASGTGQTSRVDALEQAIDKTKKFGFSLEGAVMASDAFFPFPDCVEIAAAAGIKAIVQPGGSLKDQLSIDAADQLNVSMVFSGARHFKH